MGSHHLWCALGVPVTGGPVVFFLALEQGASFSARTSVACLLGLIALAAFALTYTLMARSRGWLASIIIAIMAFLDFCRHPRIPATPPRMGFLPHLWRVASDARGFPQFSTVAATQTS